MGQKVHSTGLRLGNYRVWKDIWTTQKNSHSDYQHQNNLVKQYLTIIFKKFNFILNSCTMHKSFNKLFITIQYYKFLKMSFKSKNLLISDLNIKHLQDYLEKLTNKKIYFKLINLNNIVAYPLKAPKNLRRFKFHLFYNNIVELMQITQITKNPEALAIYIAHQFERMKKHNVLKNFLKVVFKEYVEQEGNGIKGLKMTISGKLNGVDRAKDTTFSYGTVPLSTIYTNVVYVHHTAFTKYGTFGINIWLHHE